MFCLRERRIDDQIGSVHLDQSVSGVETGFRDLRDPPAVGIARENTRRHILQPVNATALRIAQVSL